jgi:DNA (cytosine-5)-methyltransferase 1
MVVRHKSGIEIDDRCFLYRLYGKFLEHYNPYGFVFENVVGLLSAAGGKHYDELKKLFKGYGYNLYPLVLKANEYGVLQKRKRLIIIGFQENIIFDGKAPEIIDNKWSTKDVFSDLPDIQANSSSIHYKTKPTDYMEFFNLRSNSDVLTWHESRPLNQIDRQKYIYAIKEKLEHNRQISYLEFEGELQTMKRGNAFTDRFKVVDPNGLSQTIVAHLAKDGHYFIYPSLSTIRSISVREAARLQSFPDNFFFEGSRGAAFKQIGNAVPPLLSEAIAKKIINSL